MSGQDDSTFTFREQALMDEQAKRSAQKTIELWAKTYPKLAQATGEEPSWKDFFYSLAKGSAAVVLGFIGLAVLWAVIQYLKAGAPAIPGVSH